MQERSKKAAPQVAPPQATPSAPISASQSNEAAQGALAEKMARNFTPLQDGSVVEARVDGAQVATHVGALWGELTSRAAGRTSFMPETPVTSFESTGIRPQLMDYATTRGLVTNPRFDSGWVWAGSAGMSGEESFINSPLAKAQVEVRAMVGDVKALATETGTVSTSTNASSALSTSQGGSVGGSAGPFTAGAEASVQRSTGASGGVGMSMPLKMTAFEGTLAFDCTVRFKRTFGPPEEKTARIVAGSVLFQSALASP